MKRFKDKQENKDNKEETVELPPRRALHISDKTKWTRYFYNSLILIFVSLTAGLLLWGFLNLTQ
jgi:hypothetical protein